MSDEVFFNKMVTKGLEPIESDGRFFEGYLTVQVKDKQGEVTIVDELYKVLPIWMDRGAPITDTHSNRVIGKGINFARSDYTDSDGSIYPAIKVTGKIYKDYELDNEIWRKIKSGEYKGLSFGGSTKTDREPMRMKDGSIAYSLSKLEHYEVAVCKDPAVPLAVITDINPIAKANMNCDHTGCYVTKPILGEPNFEAATRKVMRESDVPRKNAKRIVGAAENKKAVICKDCGLPKKKAKKVLPDKSRGIMSLSDQGRPFTEQQEDARGVYDDKICPHCQQKIIDPETDLGVTSEEYEKLGDISTRKSKSDTCSTCGQNKYGQHNFVHDRMYDDIDNEGRYYKRDDKTGVHNRVYNFNDATHYSKRTAPYEEASPENYHNQTPKHTLHDIETHKDFKKHPSYPEHQKFLKEWKTHPMNPKNRKKGKGVKERKKRKKQSQGIGNKRNWSTFKSLLDTNKVLGKYQGNAISLARILDKDAPKDIARPHQTGNVPKKNPKEPKGQSHAAQSTEARLGTETGDISPSEGWYRDSQGGQPDISGRDESVMNYVNPDTSDLRYIKPSFANPRGDPRKRKSLFDEIRNKIKVSRRGSRGWGGKYNFALPSTSGKKKDKPNKNRKGGNEAKNRKQMETMSPEVRANYDRNMEAMAAGKDKKSKKKIKKVGSSLPESGIDPNQANQGAGFGMRNQTPPKRKMEAKLGDGTYDYSS